MLETFDQIAVPRGIAGDAVHFLKEGDVVQVLAYGEEALGVELEQLRPLDVDLDGAR